MIRSFLVLALPLAISTAASSNVAVADDADFDVDDVEFTAKVMASTNQFQGNRRKNMNNVFRNLSVSPKCITETEGLEGIGFMAEFESDFSKAILMNMCNLSEIGKKATCDLTDMFSFVHESCFGGQIIGLVMAISTTGAGEETVTTTFKNMALCIGASCDVEGFIKYMQEDFDAFYENSDDSYTVESGAQSTRMHYGAAVASALAMAGVVFLN